MNANGNERIAALEKKQREITEKLVAEKESQRKRDAALNKKILMALGQAVMDTAAQNEGFALMLRQTLGSVVTDERSRKLLTSRGLL